MTALLRIAAMVVRHDRRAFLRGVLLSALVLAMGVALLALSGWFIVAAAAAGLAGIGILFNVFAPSAMVRFLALGRTAARYGERVLTHDATLRALSHMRIRLLAGLLRSPWRELEKVRANLFLNRVTADIDALDGVLLRLVLPGLAGAAIVAATGLALWVLVDPRIAVLIITGYLAGPTLTFLIGQHVARRPSRRTEAAMQAGRSRLIDLIGARDDLAVYGRLQSAAAAVRAAWDRHATARDSLDRIERRTGAALDLVAAAVTAGALGLGATLAQTGTITAAEAAIGVFAALALAEAAAPVRRALSEIGRMAQAARRVLPPLTADAPMMQTAPAAPARIAVPLHLDAVTHRAGPLARDLFAPVTLTVGPGETVALTGASGIGKSTVLLMAAGVLAPSSGRVTLGGLDLRDIDEATLRRQVATVPQRHALIAGAIAENLRLAAPSAGDDDLWQALGAVCLADTVTARGGLATRLGPRGAGLSGGEARRLVLARALLCVPSVLLLDEPTEGLDRDTAKAVLRGLRHALPEAAILMAAHRAVETQAADRTLLLRQPDADAR